MNKTQKQKYIAGIKLLRMRCHAYKGVSAFYREMLRKYTNKLGAAKMAVEDAQKAFDTLKKEIERFTENG